MPVIFDRPSMAAGELSSSVWGRVDLAKYQVGMATVLNWFIHAHGGASTRAGTQFVGEVQDHTVRSRLIDFNFRDRPDGQNYALEFGQGTMRVSMNGGDVLETIKPITGITQSNPGVVTCVAHGYATGDHVWIDAVAGMTRVNQREFTIIVTGANTFQINVDTSGYDPWTSGGGVARIYMIASPYAAADLPLLKYVQNADTMTLTHPSYVVYKLVRTGHTAWTFTPATYGPVTVPPTALAAGAGANSYVVTAIDDASAEESPPSVAVVGAGTVTWTNTAGSSLYNVYKASNGIYGFIGQSSSGAVGFNDTGIIPDVSDTPPSNRNPFLGPNKNPGCSGYHDGRKWYGFTNDSPESLFSSQSSYEYNMNVSSPTKDSDAITRTIRSRKANYIRHLVSLNDLIVFTSGAEFKCWAGAASDVLTPGACILRVQSNEGCNDMPPIPTKNSVIFASGSSKKVLDLNYNAISSVWESRDMSILSDHLFENRVVQEWAYCKDPNGVVWVVRDDGVLLGFTYLKEHDVYAWHRHTTDGLVESVCAVQENNETMLYMIVKRTVGGVTKRYKERMATRVLTDVQHAWCLDSARQYDGWNYDAVRSLTISGATYAAGDPVTLSATRFTPFTVGSIGTQYLLRDAATGSQVSVTITAYTDTSHVTATLDQAPYTSLQNTAIFDWALAIVTMTGLWHIEGKSISMLVDGNVQPAVIVSHGTAALERPAGLVLAGLSYVCDLETLSPAMQAAGGSIQGRPQRIAHTVVRVRNTRGLKVGPSFDKLTDIKERTTENFGQPIPLQTKDEALNLPATWSKGGKVCIRQSYPLPATVTGIFPQIEVGDVQ